VLLEGQESTASGQGRTTLTSVVWPGYFQTLRIPLLRGRDFAVSDIKAAPRVAIVNEAAAAYFWPGQDPIGKQLHFFGDKLPAEVVAVARNANYQALGEPPQALIYLSLVQYYFPAAVVYIRAAGDPEAASAAVKRRMQPLDRNLLLQSESLGKTIRESLWAQRLSAALLAGFGGLALFLSTIGLYGVMSHTVNQRVREFGVRMAMGATPGDVQMMIVGEGVRMVAIGGIAGMGLAMVGARAVKSMLFSARSWDAVTFSLVPSLLVLVGLLACWIPSARATRIHPASALRDE